MKTIIRGGRVVDPAQRLDAPLDVVIDQGRVVSLVKRGAFRERGKVIDASGCVVAPGLVDLHAHLREPGFEGAETIVSGANAAVAGGYTSVCCMANTEPINDNRTVTGYILAQAKNAACKIYPVGATTVGLKGERIANLGELKEAGAVAYSNDGVPVRNSELQRRVFELAEQLHMVVMSHAEDPDMVADGQMNEGFTSTELGLPGISAVAEEIAVARDILLSKLTGCRLHLCHLSTAGSLDLVRWAKRQRIPITCEATPHHFTLTDVDVGDYNTNCKMSPPLRGAKDRAALVKAMAAGLVDAIATDHAPHGILKKQTEFDGAANGIIGLETALGLTLRLVESGDLTLSRAIELLATAPARIIGLEAGSLAPGRPADVCVFDPRAKFVYTRDRIHSKSENSPFIDWELPGVVRYTLVNGRLAYAGS